LILDPGVTAALAIGLAAYIVVLWPAAAGAERWLAVGSIWMLALLSASGLTLSARVLAGMTALKVAAFAGIVGVAFGAGAGSWAHFQPLLARPAATVPVSEALALGVIGVFFSFGGFWEASRIASDIRNPARTVPAALAIGVATVTAIYVATTVAFIYLVPVQDVTSAPEFARRAGVALLGSSGPTVLAAIVVVSVATSMLALLIMAPRLYVAMSDDGLFLSFFASVSATTGAPSRAILLLAFLATVFVLVGTFQQIVALFLCTTLIFIALAAAALVVVRGDGPAPAFSAPGYPLTVVLFVILVLSVVFLVAIARPVHALAGFAIVLAGWPAHRLLARPRAHADVFPSP
jgi:APA family basic amino acid/polyamine antiporter